MIWVMQLFSSTVFGGPCVTSNILHNILGIQLQKTSKRCLVCASPTTFCCPRSRRSKILNMLKSLVLYLRQVSLVLNASTTKLITTGGYMNRSLCTRTRMFSRPWILHVRNSRESKVPYAFFQCAFFKQ